MKTTVSVLQKHIPFVKEQVAFQQRMLERYVGDSYRQKLHGASREKFESLVSDLESADKTLDSPITPPRDSIRQNSTIRLSLTPEEVEGLPAEVLNELSISEGDKAEFAVLSLMEEAGGVISLDRLIVGLWRKTGEIHKRQNLISRLYRMGQKDMVFSVPGKKGVYSSRPVSEADFQRLMDATMQDAQDTGVL